MIEKEDELMEQIWREVKAMAGKRVHLHCFVEAVGSEVEQQELT
jgi:hypothetical protein